jgi:hypothetical protein
LGLDDKGGLTISTPRAKEGDIPATIRVTGDVVNAIAEAARPGESFNATLRRLLGLPPKQR